MTTANGNGAKKLTMLLGAIAAVVSGGSGFAAGKVGARDALIEFKEERAATREERKSWLVSQVEMQQRLVNTERDALHAKVEAQYNTQLLKLLLQNEGIRPPSRPELPRPARPDAGVTLDAGP